MADISTAPRDGTAIVSDIGIVGWAQELWKAPPPFLQRGANYEPELSREGGWRRMTWTDVLGFAFTMPMDIVHPSRWISVAPDGLEDGAARGPDIKAAVSERDNDGAPFGHGTDKEPSE